MCVCVCPLCILFCCGIVCAMEIVLWKKDFPSGTIVTSCSYLMCLSNKSPSELSTCTQLYQP